MSQLTVCPGSRCGVANHIVGSASELTCKARAGEVSSNAAIVALKAQLSGGTVPENRREVKEFVTSGRARALLNHELAEAGHTEWSAAGTAYPAYTFWDDKGFTAVVKRVGRGEDDFAGEFRYNYPWKLSDEQRADGSYDEGYGLDADGWIAGLQESEQGPYGYNDAEIHAPEGTSWNDMDVKARAQVVHAQFVKELDYLTDRENAE